MEHRRKILRSGTIMYEVLTASIHGFVRIHQTLHPAILTKKANLQLSLRLATVLVVFLTRLL